MLIYNAVCWFTTQNSDWIRGVLNDYVLCWSNKQHVDCLRCVDWLHGLLIDFALCWLTMQVRIVMNDYWLRVALIECALFWFTMHCAEGPLLFSLTVHCLYWLRNVLIDYAIKVRLLLWSWWLNNKKKFNSEALLSNSKPGFRFSNIVYRKSKNWKIGILVF